MSNKTLRTLAKEYANGVIDKESYRKARDELLLGILSGNIPVLKIDYRPPLDVEDLDITRDKTTIKPQPAAKQEPKPTTEIVPPPPPPPPPPKKRAPARASHPSSSPLKVILITSIIATICVIIIVATYNKSEKQEPLTRGDLEINEPEVQQELIPPPTTSDAGIVLIEQFIAKKNWADTSISQFVTDWNSLSAEEKSAALSSPVKTQLANAINRQLIEERALLSLGDTASVINRQRALVNFAEQVGIDDARIKVQEIDENILQPATDDSSDEPADEDTAGANEPEVTVKEITETVTVAENEITSEPEYGTSVTGAEPANITTTESTASEIKSPVSEVKPVSRPEPEMVKETESPASTTTSNKNSCHIDLARQRQPYCRDIIDDIGKGPTLVVIPGGKFMMGGEKPHEQPRHEVVISSPFAIAVNEITRGEFEQFCTNTQRNCPQQPWSDKEYPVVNVSWNDAVAYTEWLSSKTGNRYRLPSEAEWEYAARAKSTAVYPFGDEILITDAVFSDIKPLTSPLPRTDRTVNRNKFRLYHMVGNVREWVLDTWADNYNNGPTDGSAYSGQNSETRVVRGGSYADNADALRSGARFSMLASNADAYTGFRIIQSLTQ